MKNLVNWEVWGKITLGKYCSRPKSTATNSNDLEVNEYFKKEILPLYEKYEPDRVKVLRNSGINFWLQIFLVLGLIYLINASYAGNIYLIMLLAILLIISIFISPAKKFKAKIYDEVYSKIISFYGDFRYQAKPQFSMRQFNDTRLIPYFHREKNYDCCYGLHKNSKIEFFNSKLYRIVDKNHMRRVFGGLVISIELNKKFKGTTLIKTDLGYLLNLVTFESGLARVKLEDPEFEKEFEVYASDQIEARYLLTTAFMVRLLEFKSSMNCRKMTASFHGQHLLIMLDGVHLEVPKFSLVKPADFADEFMTLHQNIGDLFTHIDQLKLNQNIGM